MALLAIDPGGSKERPSIGYALFNSDGEELERGVLSWEQLVQGLQWPGGSTRTALFWPKAGVTTVDRIVCEDFVNNAKSRGGQTNGTSELIGWLDGQCFVHEVPFTRQPNTILPVAKLHAGYSMPINPRTKKPVQHLPDQDSAFLHGFEFLVRTGVIEVDLSDTMGGSS